MNRWAWVATGLATAVIVLGFSTYVMMTGPDQSQRAATIVQGFTSLALLVVTAAYVALTKQLVNVQRNPISALQVQAQHAIALELLPMVIKAKRQASAIQQWFPIAPESTTSPSLGRDRNITGLSDFATTLEEKWKLAPPSLMQSCSDTQATVIRCLLELDHLLDALDSEDNSVLFLGLAGGWSFSRASTYFSESWPPEQPEPPTFEELAAGSAAERIDLALTALYEDLQQYLGLRDTSKPKGIAGKTRLTAKANSGLQRLWKLCTKKDSST
jgi:hypothetical protein